RRRSSEPYAQPGKRRRHFLSHVVYSDSPRHTNLPECCILGETARYSDLALLEEVLGRAVHVTSCKRVPWLAVMDADTLSRPVIHHHEHRGYPLAADTLRAAES